MNKGVRGLGPLKQTAVQAAGISVCPFTEIQTESSITITLVQIYISGLRHPPEKGKRNGKMPQIRCKLSPKETEL